MYQLKYFKTWHIKKAKYDNNVITQTIWKSQQNTSKKLNKN